MAWVEFLLALAVFVAAHVIPARARAPLVARLGRRGYIAGFSLLSFALLLWLIVAAGRAPHIPLWPQEPWMRWLVNLVMPLAVLVALWGGMAGLLLAFLAWAGAHLLANGDLAHAILFGGLGGYAGLGLARLQRPLRLRPGWGSGLAALAIWAALYHLHPWFAGVSPAP